MNDKLLILPQPIQPAGGPSAARPARQEKDPSISFDKVLDAHLKTHQLIFSRHAADRMANRGIEFTQEEMTRLADAVDLARRKGAKDSLVLLEDTALVVSIKNNTVVTVVDKESLTGNLFTNIDSAVIA